MGDALELNLLLFWGVFGLIVEIIFTAIFDLISKRNFNLMGHTSLWMFPVYSLGLTYGFDLVQEIIPHDVIRYLSYPLWIWLVEIIVGYPALQFGIRIWDYSYLPQNKQWKGIISFVHFPVWVVFGILVEFVDTLI